jgi:hypothetical protein
MSNSNQHLHYDVHGADVNIRVCGTSSTPTQCRGDSTETRTNFTMQWLQEEAQRPFCAPRIR